jgi:D-arabinose 1-dehydrogenase-like Zn-dependent alcohol dehydrogenase
MRSYQIEEWGKPLVYAERPTPTPQGREVLLRITAAGVCHSDIHIHDGFFDLGGGNRVELAKMGAKLPLTLGHEIVGVVEALGPEAKGVSVGDARIAFPWIGCHECPVCAHEREQWCASPQFLGARVDGGYSDHVIVPDPDYLVAYDGIPTEAACTYACAGLTAYAALAKVGDLTADDFLVVIGAGGVGLSGLHIAPELTPAKIILAETDPAKRAIAEEAGVFATIDNGAPDAPQKLLEMTGGGARASVDFVGAPATSQFGIMGLRKGGRHVIVGLYGGALPLPLPMVVSKSLTIQGSYVGTLDDFKAVVALGRAGKIPSIPLDVRPLDQAPAALDDLRAGRVRGRVILTP